jgi:3-(3-hydroxy-phenyl)propionate hydroxylase
MTAAAPSASRGQRISWSGSARSRRFLEKALGWRLGRGYYRGEQIFRLEMPQPRGEKYLPMYNLQQQYIRNSCTMRSRRATTIDMRWQANYRPSSPTTMAYRFEFHRPPGDYRLDVPIMCLLPTERARVRSMLDTAEGRQLRRPVCDRGYPRMDHDFPTERRAFFEPRQSRRHGADSQAAGHIWRVDYQPRRRERGGCPERGKHSAPASAPS